MFKSVCSALILGGAIIALPVQAAEQIFPAEDDGLQGSDFEKSMLTSGNSAFDFEYHAHSNEELNVVGSKDAITSHQVSAISATRAPFIDENEFVPTATLPEPGTWLLMLFGFAAIGAFMRLNSAGSRATKRVRYNF